MTKIDFFPLGGIDERGKNCYVLTINGDSYIVNFGISTIPTVKAGIQWIAPDVNWLKNNRPTIKGIFIGTPGVENAGALDFFAAELGSIPIYTTEIGANIISAQFNKINKQNIRILTSMKPEKIGRILVTPFLIFNQLPCSVGFVFTTEIGSVVYVDDFVISSNNAIAFQDEISSISKITQHKCVALIANCSMVGDSVGFTNPKHRPLGYFDKILCDNLNSRIVFAFYDNNFYRVLTLISLSTLKNRPICILSKFLFQQIQFLRQKNYFNSAKTIFIREEELAKYPNAIIIVFESKLLVYDQIIDLLDKNDGLLEKESSVVVFAENTIAGYERDESNMFDEIAKTNVKFYRIPSDILPTKASNEDHKHLIALLNPKYIIPVSGLYRHLIEYQKMALQCKIAKQQIILLKNGKGVSFENSNMGITSSFFNVDYEDQYVTSSGNVGEADNNIAERNLMKSSGVVVANILYDKQKNTVIRHKYTITGVVEKSPENDKIINSIIEECNRNIVNLLGPTSNLQYRDAVNEMRRAIAKMFNKKFEKRPIILLNLMFANEIFI